MCFVTTGVGWRWTWQINAAAEVIYQNVDPTANIIFGALVDERMEGEMSITVLATGFQTVVGLRRPLCRLIYLAVSAAVVAGAVFLGGVL